MGEHVQPALPTAIGSDFTSSDCGDHGGTASGPPLMPGAGFLAINGNQDLSRCVVGNEGACVYTVYVGMTAAYWEIWVDAQGPKGAGSGNLWLVFTDQAGESRRLKIHDSTRKWHWEVYTSDKPGIVQLDWSDEKP